MLKSVMCPSAPSQEEELHWLALRLVPGLGARSAARLIERFRTPEAVLRASPSELEAAGVPGAVAQSLASGCAFDEAVDQQHKLRNEGVTLIGFTDPRYPQALRDIFDPPLVLFARGRLELLASVMLGVVGTRRPTPYGLAAAERLGRDLANSGLTIVSGMARGIDTTAHKAALAVGGNTVAVFGCGLDVTYPSENRKLAGEIGERGLLLSEFPMGATAYPQNFPIRNRIISGLSVGVLVVEGAMYSGSAITAKLAMEQGREVFAVPGNITSRGSWGPNLLIKQGARLVQEWTDVVENLPSQIRERLIAEGKNRLLGQASDGQPSLPLAGDSGAMSEVSRWVLDRLQVDAATHLDQLLDNLERGSPSELLAALFELEMLGLVRQLPGKNFVKVW